MTGPGADVVSAARASADAAAARSRVEVRAITTVAETEACEQLFRAVWQVGDQAAPMAADLIMGLVAAGSYVGGAFDHDRSGAEQLVGACVGVWHPPAARSMHSHIAGVLPAGRGRDLGYALKLDQRAYVLAHGGTTIGWTFDPLVARNAHFNLRKLGARPVAYKINYYGVLTDGISGGEGSVDESDRLLLSWDLASERVRRACDDRLVPAVTGPDSMIITAPDDIEGLRHANPAEALRWRHRLRAELQPAVAAGRVDDFDRGRGGYVVTATGS